MLTCSFFFSPASAGFPPSFHNCSLFSLLNNLFFMAGFISPASFHKKARLPTFLSLLRLSKYVCNLAFLFFLLHLIAGFITTVVLFASVCTIHTLWRLFLLRESLSRLRICTVRIRKLFLYVCFIFESQGCCLVSTLILLSTLVLLSHRCFRCQSVSASRSFYFLPFYVFAVLFTVEKNILDCFISVWFQSSKFKLKQSQLLFISIRNELYLNIALWKI